jgi:hypothetical protein
MRIHTTISVYLNGDYKTNGVREDLLESHIEYNKTMRFGRALLVDGKVVHLGYYNESDRKILEKKFKHVKVDKDTQPYV